MNTPQILDARGNPIAREPRRDLRARYDAAEVDGDSYRHWANADHLSARAANSIEVRRRLRDRARYEAANNTYLDGIAQTLANDMVGTGPSLQLNTGDDGVDTAIEAEFSDWMDAVQLPQKLKTMRRAKCVDGEAFGLHITNDRLPTPVKLDLLLIEGDQFHTPFPHPIDEYAVDGIKFDTAWNPTEYHLLEVHPGDLISIGYFYKYDIIPADLVSHWFLRKRPQQFRGVPDVTTALPLFAQLRRYTLAVVAAAETAADFAAVVYTELPPDSGLEVADPFEALNITRRMMTTLPAGYKMGQFRAEQPTTSYPDFKHELLNEIARCVLMPYNVAAGNSSSYNYSSGRLDHQVYFRALDVDRGDCTRSTLDPLFDSWVREARLAMPGLIPPGLVGPGRRLRRQWLWPAMETIDPEKEANAQDLLLRNFGISFSELCRKDGVEPETRLDLIAKDIAGFESRGIPLPSAWQPKPGPTPSPNSGGANGDSQGSKDAAGRQNGHGLDGLFHRRG